MTSLIGHDAARAAFVGALQGGSLHHAWLLTGPEGVGKATFARSVAKRMLAEAATPDCLPPGLSVPDDHQAARLIAAGTHPDYREMRRLPKDPEKPDQDIARSIPIAQVRALTPLFATKPALSARRVVVIDAVDDLERPGASNAMLKNLEEPPQGTIFLLVSHAPGRLLPTIRSRCRTLRFEPLSMGDMRAVLGAAIPEAERDEVEALVRAGAGSPGRALAYAGLDLGGIDAALSSIGKSGDRNNVQRGRLAKALSAKAAQPRYEAFLERVPGFIAEQAPYRAGDGLRTALDAYEEARSIAGAARALSLDAGSTVFELAGVVARLAR